MRIPSAFLALLAVATAAGCSSGLPVRPWEKPSEKERTVEKSFNHMNSTFRVRIYLSGEEKAAPGKILRAAIAEIQRVALLTHPTHLQSDLRRVNEGAGKGPVKVSPEFMEMLVLSQQMWKRSEGAFNVTFQPGIEKLNNKELDLVIDQRAGTVRFNSPATQLNLYGMARGFALERAARRLRGSGIAGFALSAGGLRAVGGTGLTDDQVMCVEDPDRLGRCGYRITAAAIPEALFIGTSASMERRGRLYHPNQNWSYRKGGVTVAGTSGPWVQFAETVTAIMGDEQFADFFGHPGPPRLSGTWFRVEPKSLRISGSLAPFAGVQKIED